MSKRRIAIFWDTKTCCVSNGVLPHVVSSNILARLGGQTEEIQWQVVQFFAYGDAPKFSQKVRRDFSEAGLQGGVLLRDIVDMSKYGRIDECSKAILVDMFNYAFDNPPPSSIMLISGDVGFCSALFSLRNRGYSVILVTPSRVGVLNAAATHTWDWSDVSKIKGSIENDVTPAELTGLKGQLVTLLESCGGSLRLVCLATEYQKRFKKHLRVSDYKACKLVDLLKKMSDVISVQGRDYERVVILKR